jgi:hypothetical protein
MPTRIFIVLEGKGRNNKSDSKFRMALCIASPTLQTAVAASDLDSEEKEEGEQVDVIGQSLCMLWRELSSVWSISR